MIRRTLELLGLVTLGASWGVYVDSVPFALGGSLAGALLWVALDNLRAGLLTDLRGKLAGPGKPIELARDALFNTFSGLGILLDTNVTKVEF